MPLPLRQHEAQPERQHLQGPGRAGGLVPSYRRGSAQKPETWAGGPAAYAAMVNKVRMAGGRKPEAWYPASVPRWKSAGCKGPVALRECGETGEGGLAASTGACTVAYHASRCALASPYHTWEQPTNRSIVAEVAVSATIAARGRPAASVYRYPCKGAFDRPGGAEWLRTGINTDS